MATRQVAWVFLALDARVLVQLGLELLDYASFGACHGEQDGLLSGHQRQIDLQHNNLAAKHGHLLNGTCRITQDTSTRHHGFVANVTQTNLHVVSSLADFQLLAVAFDKLDG